MSDSKNTQGTKTAGQEIERTTGRAITYKIVRNKTGRFLVFMDWNHEKVVQLADTLDADPALVMDQYTGNKKANMHTIHLHVAYDSELRGDSEEAQKAYIDAICKPILSE